MHCDAFPSSLRTSLHPSALGLAARSAEARGPAPWTPAEEHGPSIADEQHLQKRLREGKIFSEVTTCLP